MDEAEVETPQFQCKIDSVKTVIDVLRAISPSKDKEQHVLVTITDEVIRFTLHDRAKSLQANANFKSDVFSDYFIREEEEEEDDEETNNFIRFRINLYVLLECLNVFGPQSMSSVVLFMSYFPSRETFRLTLQEKEVITECEIRTLAGEDDDIDFTSDFRSSETVNQALVNSEYLKEAFIEFAELSGAACLHLSMTNVAPFFRLSSTGSVGSCVIDFPQGSETFVNFSCKKPMKTSYRLSLIQHATQALNTASKTMIRVNNEGMICLQHKIEAHNGKDCYVDFIVLPDDETGYSAE